MDTGWACMLACGRTAHTQTHTGRRWLCGSLCMTCRAAPWHGVRVAASFFLSWLIHDTHAAADLSVGEVLVGASAARVVAGKHLWGSRPCTHTTLPAGRFGWAQQAPCKARAARVISLAALRTQASARERMSDRVRVARRETSENELHASLTHGSFEDSFTFTPTYLDPRLRHDAER